VETLWLRTLYVLVFIELGTRRVFLTSSTVHPALGLAYPAGEEPLDGLG